jgi:hypothetical protein
MMFEKAEKYYFGSVNILFGKKMLVKYFSINYFFPHHFRYIFEFLLGVLEDVFKKQFHLNNL